MRPILLLLMSAMLPLLLGAEYFSSPELTEARANLIKAQDAYVKAAEAAWLASAPGLKLQLKAHPLPADPRDSDRAKALLINQYNESIDGITGSFKLWKEWKKTPRGLHTDANTIIGLENALHGIGSKIKKLEALNIHVLPQQTKEAAEAEKPRPKMRAQLADGTVIEE